MRCRRSGAAVRNRVRSRLTGNTYEKCRRVSRVIPRPFDAHGANRVRANESDHGQDDETGVGSRRVSIGGELCPPYCTPVHTHRIETSKERGALDGRQRHDDRQRLSEHADQGSKVALVIHAARVEQVKRLLAVEDRELRQSLRPANSLFVVLNIAFFAFDTEIGWFLITSGQIQRAIAAL